MDGTTVLEDEVDALCKASAYSVACSAVGSGWIPSRSSYGFVVMHPAGSVTTEWAVETEECRSVVVSERDGASIWGIPASRSRSREW